jgi:hypothetical protein
MHIQIYLENPMGTNHFGDGGINERTIISWNLTDERDWTGLKWFRKMLVVGYLHFSKRQQISGLVKGLLTSQEGFHSMQLVKLDDTVV